MNVAGVLFFNGAVDAREESRGAQIHVLIELAAYLDKQAPQGDVVGNAGITCRPEVNRGMLGKLRNALVRQLAPVALYVSQLQSKRFQYKAKPKSSEAFSRTRMPSGRTSLPMSSPGMPAME